MRNHHAQRFDRHIYALRRYDMETNKLTSLRNVVPI